MSKGSQRRPEDNQRFREGYDRVFRSPTIDDLITPEMLDSMETAEKALDLMDVLSASLKKWPMPHVLGPDFCRDPENCNGSCRREIACND